MNGESKTRRRSHLTLVPPSKEQEWVFGLPAGPRPSPRSVHRLKISLRGARPPIWRRVEVPSTIRFSELHRVIQEAMGWLDLSAHQFVHDDHVIGVPDDEALETVHDERRIELWAVAPEPGDRLEYEYDFRAFWAHTIVVEAVSLEQEPLTTVADRAMSSRTSSPEELAHEFA
ncbi:MAG: plasmid pRiA4b ORF-3 family protein [Myxococcales bacterium]|nr:plasmid pRiA4b ORF-3 family protein [Myxococcales bacterium]